jgi:hypothetical protein
VHLIKKERVIAESISAHSSNGSSYNSLLLVAYTSNRIRDQVPIWLVMSLIVVLLVVSTITKLVQIQ